MARNKKNNKANSNNSSPRIRALNNVVEKILSVTDSNYSNISEIESKNVKFQEIMNRELDIANGVSHGSILDFVQSQREGNQKNVNTSNPATIGAQSTGNIFTENIDQIYNYLIEMYDNKYIEMADMSYICKFIPVLGQTIKTNLNHLTASDSIAEGIKRSITFDTQIEEDVKNEIINMIEQIEQDLHLHKRLKNSTFKETLTCGSAYVYCIPLVDLFNEYSKKKEAKTIKTTTNMYLAGSKKNAKHSNKATESVEYIESDDELESLYKENYEDAVKSATESIGSIISGIPETSFAKTISNGGITKASFISNTNQEITDIIDAFHYIQGDIISDAMESMNAYVSMGFNKSNMKRNKDTRPIQYPDGVEDPRNKNVGLLEENEITGCYVKYISSRDIVPFKIFNQVVGYYHIVTKKKKQTRTTAVNGGGIFASSMDIANQKKEKAMTAIVDSISNMIMKNFNHDFLCENQEFKSIIADCIIAKGIADNEYSIQFIPAKYIYEFKINEDINGNGQSILADSLLSGKMLLSYLVSKLILFVNNTGDKTIVTEHKGPIDLYGKNQIDRVVRQLEGQNITFGDFLSPNIMFNKFNRNANIIVPTSQSGTKLLEFEKLEGKSMDMGTEMEEKLEKMALIGSGTPESILEYSNDLQFSRQIVSSSIKYAGDISSIQSEIEEPMTELYKTLVGAENITEKAKNALQYMKITLHRPRVIANGNNSENLRTSKEVSELIGELYYGAEPEEKDILAKKEFILRVCKDITTFFEWNRMDEIKSEVDVKFHGPIKTEEDSTTEV